jgi:hypothetical protein
MSIRIGLQSGTSRRNPAQDWEPALRLGVPYRMQNPCKMARVPDKDELERLIAAVMFI